MSSLPLRASYKTSVNSHQSILYLEGLNQTGGKTLLSHRDLNPVKSNKVLQHLADSNVMNRYVTHEYLNNECLLHNPLSPLLIGCLFIIRAFFLAKSFCFSSEMVHDVYSRLAGKWAHTAYLDTEGQ